MRFASLAALWISALGVACGGRADSAPSSGTAGAPSAPAPSSSPTSCDASAAADIEVSSDDLKGFPPYAAAGCTLAYVSRTGELVVRDLATRVESVIAPAAERPRRPTASAELVAWEADDNGRSVVRVRSGGVVRTIEGAFVSAGEPRANGENVAFTGWNGPAPGDDSDVWLYDAKTADVRVVLGGPGQQRFADVSSAYVAATDFAEDPDGRFDNDGMDLADIVLFDRATGAVVKRHLAGKQAFPMLANDGVVAYLAWNGVHPEPKLVAYELRSGTALGDPLADVKVADVVYASSEYARPAVSAGTLEWIANPDGRTTLYRAPADGSSPPLAVKGLDDLQLYAPSPTSAGFTVLATSPVGSAVLAPRLRAVPR
jgi:hypothetical protein